MILSVFICVHLWFHSSAAFAQEPASQELAVNLAEGRVVICAAKDGIILATIDSHGEPGSRPPEVAALGALRAGVILGAVEWVRPETQDKPIRLDAEFPHIAAAALNISGRPNDSDAASDIEAIGVAVLERLRLLADALHNKINLAEDEPLIRVVLAGFIPNYGPEAWTLDYHVRQDDLGNGYWRTRVLRPSYTQLYPPEKGQPHTLVEVRYPPENRAKDEPELLDLLQQNDPRLARIRAANAILAKSVGFVVEGQSQKSDAASDIDFLKSALAAVTPPEGNLTMANVNFDRGFQWVLEPREPAGLSPADAKPPADSKPQEPGAPTLRRKSEK